jgi:hypothetical protein
MQQCFATAAGAAAAAALLQAKEHLFSMLSLWHNHVTLLLLLLLPSLMPRSTCSTCFRFETTMLHCCCCIAAGRGAPVQHAGVALM